MRQIIVRSRTFLTLLGGGPIDPAMLRRVLDRAPVLVAADGGADAALRAGLMPKAVIGDMDSISQGALEQIPPHQQHCIKEQDSTDFDKCLRHIQASVILALGFSGGRLDHQLAVCTTLTRYPEQNCIVIGAQDVMFLAPEAFSLDLPIGTRFSLFPMAPSGGKSLGLKYPIDGVPMSPSTRVGTSNEVTGPVEIAVQNRAMLVVLPVACLQDVIDMFVAQNA